jgi:predicted CXXCH cytochrome family protein
VRGNINLAGEFYGMHADIFWATFQRMPFLYFKKNTVMTIHDLTEVRIDNSKSKADRREAWRKSKKAVIRDKVRKLPFSLLPKRLLMWVLNVFGFRFSVKRAKHIFTPSNFVKEDVVDYFKIKSDKVSITVNGGVLVSDKEEPEPVKELIGEEFLLYVGTDFAHKNINILVEVLDLLRNKKPGLHLVFAGRKDRNYTTIQERAKELGLEDRVHVLGFVSAGEKVWLFKNAQLYVFPSLSEGFGIPVLEAMAYGLPVVASSLTAIPEVCGDAAVYFDPTDKADIAEKVLSTIDNEKLKKKLVKEGKEKVSCTTCHNGHHGAGHFDGKKGEDIESVKPYLHKSIKTLCIDCHKAQADPAKNHPMNNEKSCKSCHELHGGKEKLLVKAQGELCQSCHFQKKINHRPLDLMQDTERARPLHFENGKFLCSTCHSPHNTQRSEKFLLDSEKAVTFCTSCHGKKGEKVYKNFHKLMGGAKN